MAIEERECECGCGEKFIGTSRRKYWKEACKMRMWRKAKANKQQSKTK